MLDYLYAIKPGLPKQHGQSKSLRKTSLNHRLNLYTVNAIFHQDLYSTLPNLFNTKCNHQPIHTYFNQLFPI